MVTQTTPPPIAVTVYGIPNCDTVKKARVWLDAQGVDVQFHDFKKQGVPLAEASQWLEHVAWDTLINRKGTTWRKLPPDQQAGVTDAASALQLAVTQPSVIKRPVVTWPDGAVTVGLLRGMALLAPACPLFLARYTPWQPFFKTYPSVKKSASHSLAA